MVASFKWVATRVGPLRLGHGVTQKVNKSSDDSCSSSLKEIVYIEHRAIGNSIYTKALLVIDKIVGTELSGHNYYGV